MKKHLVNITIWNDFRYVRLWKQDVKLVWNEGSISFESKYVENEHIESFCYRGWRKFTNITIPRNKIITADINVSAVETELITELISSIHFVKITRDQDDFVTVWKQSTNLSFSHGELCSDGSNPVVIDTIDYKNWLYVTALKIPRRKVVTATIDVRVVDQSSRKQLEGKLVVLTNWR